LFDIAANISPRPVGSEEIHLWPAFSFLCCFSRGSVEANMILGRRVNKMDGKNKEVVITKNGHSAAVLRSHDKLESLMETSAIRSDTSLMREIRKGLSDLKQKRARLYSLGKLFR
jgi:PHD/YefM family antitoxin component YafN of YafNO toxin-antitoxin module